MIVKHEETVRATVRDGHVYWLRGRKYVGGEELDVPKKGYEADPWRFQLVEISEQGNKKKGGVIPTAKDKRLSEIREKLVSKGVSV